ncbi:Aminopeptidase, partial [Caligus rogercresseyi]
ITLEAPKGKTVLSNTLVSKEEEKDSSIVTYLIAIVIGNYESLEGKTNNDVLVRVFTPPGKTSQGQLTLDTTISPSNSTTTSSRCPTLYPSATALAMENWGLILFRDSYVLYDPATTSNHKKRDTIATITHEIAHQWFGNLVTMEWWTHLWLNEGFASFMGNLCAMSIFPEMDFNVDFVVDSLSHSLKLDALKSSHPIE